MLVEVAIRTWVLQAGFTFGDINKVPQIYHRLDVLEYIGSIKSMGKRINSRHLKKNIILNSFWK